MALYYKQVDAVQFLLTQEQKNEMRERKPVFFEGYQVKYLHGNVYMVLIPYGESLIRLYETQWLVKEKPGWQIYSATDFNNQFIAATKVNQ